MVREGSRSPPVVREWSLGDPVVREGLEDPRGHPGDSTRGPGGVGKLPQRSWMGRAAHLEGRERTEFHL